MVNLICRLLRSGCSVRLVLPRELRDSGQKDKLGRRTHHGLFLYHHREFIPLCIKPPQ